MTATRLATTATRFILQACAHCGGDLMRDPDQDLGPFRIEFVCIQCGRHAFLEPAAIERALNVARLLEKAG